MARTDTLGNFLTDVADAIKNKKGDDTPILASEFDTEITNLPSGGSNNNVFVDTSLTYDTTYDGGIRSLIKSIDLIDTSNMTNMSNMFNTCTKLTTIPLLNTSNVTNMSSMFEDCIALNSVPLLDTSKVTSMHFMFRGCNSLKNVPLFDISSATNISNMFGQNRNLTDTSLDNILQMCIGATAYTGTKKLETLGFSKSDYPVSRIQALPHYQDFIDAGWTIGY